MKPIKTNLPFINGYWDTRIGGRTENQDSCGFIDTEKGFIALVCDGMGGGPAGQLASSTAVQKIVEYVVNAPDDMPRKDILKQAVEYAHHAILQLGSENPALRGMGTTVTALLINQQSAIVAHVGDSRIYQFRRGRKIFRTADHSMVAELVRSGTLTEEQARLSSQANIITRALGGTLDQLAEAEERPYEKGDRFLLCTDGIWGAMPEKDLIRRTAKTPSLSGAVDSTVIEVDEIGRNNGNTHDNLTMALLETKQDSILKETMSKRTLQILGVLAAVCLISLVVNGILASKLLSSNPLENEVSLLNHKIEQKDKEIDDLKKQKEELNKVITQKDREAAKQDLEAAKQEREEAKKAQEETARNAQEAKDAAKRAQEEADKLRQGTNVDSTRKSVINMLTRASKMKENNERKQLRSSAIHSLKTLASQDKRNQIVYKEIIEKLGNKVATSDNDPKGHYITLINKLKKIK